MKKPPCNKPPTDDEDTEESTTLSPGSEVLQINAMARLSEVLGSMANQAQAKRFLQNVGLHPTGIGKNEENYISYRIAPDHDEDDVVNLINGALGYPGVKASRDYGPPIKRITKTLRWVWEVPRKGCIVFYPHTMKVAFMNSVEDDIGE